jgi:hypothetical protein
MAFCAGDSGGNTLISRAAVLNGVRPGFLPFRPPRTKQVTLTHTGEYRQFHRIPFEAQALIRRSEDRWRGPATGHFPQGRPADPAIGLERRRRPGLDLELV